MAAVMDTSTFHEGLVMTSQSSNESEETRFIPLADGAFDFMGFVLTITFVVGSFINALCLFVFASNKRLRSPTNIFVMSLNICDFLMCFVGTPLAMTSAWSHHWLWGDTLCKVEAFTVYFLGMASMYILMAIAFDRYIAISKPLLGYKITKKVAILCTLGCYLGGLFWAVCPLVGWNEYDLEGAGISCSVVWESIDPVNMSYIYTIFLTCFVLPVGIMGYSYGGVIGTLRSLNKTSVWDMNSRVGRKNLAIERKMLKTSVFIVGSFLGCWMPYTLVSLVTAFHGGHLIPPFLATIPPVIAKSQGLLNPVIYVATNQQFRQAFVELLPCDGLKTFLLAEKDVEPEAESEESDVEDDGKSKKSSTKKGNKSSKTSTKKSLKKKPSKNAIHHLNVDASDIEEGVSEISRLETPVATNTIHIISVSENAQAVAYTSDPQGGQGGNAAP